MKILQILPSLELGGVERGVVDLSRALKRRGDETIVVSSGGALVKELEKMGVKHITLPVHKKSLLSLRLVPELANIIERERVEIVHARSRVPGWIAWLAARKTGTPFVTTCHGYYSNHVLSKIMGWGSRVIAISRIIARHMVDDFGVDPERIRLVHRGIDLDQFAFDPTRYEHPTRTYRIINIARLSPIKGQLEFIKAIHLLKSKLPQIEVWIVGSEGKGKTKYTELLKHTVEQLGLTHCVKFLGTRRDIQELLKQSDMLMLSTLVPEAFGRVVVEAGAVGTAVCATRVGGVLDIIDSGENGLLVPPGDIEAMAEGMYDLLMNRGKCKEFAFKLRKKIETHFTLNQMLEKTVEVYQEARAYKKILVIKLGAAGDVILAVPSLRMLHQRFPQSEVHVLVDKRNAPLLSNCPYIKRCVLIDRSKLQNFSYLLRLAKRLRKGGYDLSIDFQNSKWTHLLAKLSGIPERYGFKRGLWGMLLNRPDSGGDEKIEPVKHQFRLLSKVGVKLFDDKLELWTSPDEEEAIQNVFSEFAGNSEFKVGLVLGSSPSWPTKRWPVEYFCELADYLQKNFKARIFLIGSKEDESLAQKFLTDVPDAVSLIGKTSLGEMTALVKKMDLVVTGDTAPLHVAAAARTKIIALYGPTDPKRHMPPAPGASVFVKHLSCQPCYSGVCKNSEPLACLTRIRVEEIAQTASKMLNAVKTRFSEKPKVACHSELEQSTSEESKL